MNSELLNLIMNPAQGPAEPVRHDVDVSEIKPGDVIETPAGRVFVLFTEENEKQYGNYAGRWITGECLSTGAPRVLRTHHGDTATVIRHY
jgi:hypothetical protein